VGYQATESKERKKKRKIKESYEERNKARKGTGPETDLLQDRTG
jgi:hypothetical protein